jgi:hypothetical protein
LVRITIKPHDRAASRAASRAIESQKPTSRRCSPSLERSSAPDRPRSAPKRTAECPERGGFRNCLGDRVIGSLLGRVRPSFPSWHRLFLLYRVRSGGVHQTGSSPDTRNPAKGSCRACLH